MSDLPGLGGEEAQAPMSAAVIGGEGQFGRWWRRILEAEGWTVRVSDRGTALTNRDVATGSSIVVLAVPMSAISGVLMEISEVIGPETALVDIASVKTPFVPDFVATRAEVISLHPLFSPAVSPVRGQTCVICSTHPGGWTSTVTSMLERSGIRLVTMTPEEHDRTMAVVQGLTHFQAISAAHALAKLGIDPLETLDTASPVYRLRLAMIGRILAQSPLLYGEIQMLNPYVDEVLTTLGSSNTTFQQLVAARDMEQFSAEFKWARDALGEFIAQALAESDEMISALATRSKG